MYGRRRIDMSLRLEPGASVTEFRDIEDVTVPIARSSPTTRRVEVEPYLLSSELCDAVNVAIALGRPLLVQGDPGVGKTRLAAAVAYRLGLPLEEAHIKSTSKGRDLLYTFDAVKRLADAQLKAVVPAGPLPAPQSYVQHGPLGRAIVRAGYGRRSVVLIDEIDKADLDFPNDLLLELDELRFDVDEAPGRSYRVPADKPELRPIIIVTNNEEKTLPGAFLRRCVFHHVTFPEDESELNQILAMHGIGDQTLRAAAIKVVMKLRGMRLAHQPGLSELLDWVEYLDASGAAPETADDIPHVGVLVKHEGDQMRVAERQRQQ